MMGREPTVSHPTNLSVLDGEHLARQTFGDRDLIREVLTLFLEQCATETPRLIDDTPGDRAVRAHRLKGAARGIGAFAFAAALERVELAPTDADVAEALAAVAEARDAAVVAVRALVDGQSG
jgi:HPt (histidine-containing phosphotransfer) domain-containing protein